MVDVVQVLALRLDTDEHLLELFDAMNDSLSLVANDTAIVITGIFLLVLTSREIYNLVWQVRQRVRLFKKPRSATVSFHLWVSVND